MRPALVLASAAGEILDEPRLLMLRARGGEWGPPAPSELIPLPPESEIFLLPGRHAAGLDPESGKVEILEELAVAAFAAPAHTLSAHPAYAEEEGAPMLPLFAYGALGYAAGRFWLCASRTDDDPRQRFSHIKKSGISRQAARLLADYPRNRLVRHIINNCVRRYDCPAARNFALGRFEAPLPSSRACNSACVGCISAQESGSPIKKTPQCRLDFTPKAEELAEVMAIHASREKKHPIYSFGQGCEGDPLINAPLLAQSIALFRSRGGPGTINCNTNGSSPEAVRLLAEAGLTSLRISLASARPEHYNFYHRPRGYTFSDVAETARTARRKGLFVSLNLLYFPGASDAPAELEALADFCAANGVAMIQWRNLNIDPGWHWRSLVRAGLFGAEAPSLGLASFMKSLRKRCPWLKFGYFNPWLGERAEIEAPMPA